MIPQHDADVDTTDTSTLDDLWYHQQQELTFYDIEYSSWKEAVKLAVERWVELNFVLMINRCRKIAKRYRLSEVAEDLCNDCIVEAYRYGENYDPTKGEFDHYLSVHLKFYPARHDVIARYRKCQGSGDDSIVVNTENMFDGSGEFTIDECDDSSALKCIESLSAVEQTFLRLKYLGNMTNVAIGKILNISECSVRYRLRLILDKIKIKGT